MTRLRREARARDTSIAAVIRAALDAHVSRPSGDDPWARSLAAVGCGRSGKSDVSANHDRYLAEDFSE